MKKTIVTIVIMLAVFLSACSGQAASVGASAGGSVAALAATATAQPTSSVITGLNTDYENALPVEEQLLLGIINLNGTDQALTKDQAASLLTALKQYQTLIQSFMPQRGTNGQGTPGAAPQQGGGSQGNPGSAPQPGGNDQSTPNATPQPMPTVSADTQAKIDAILKQVEAVLTSKQISAIAAMKLSRDSFMTVMQSQNLGMGGRPGGNNNSGTSQPGGNGGNQPGPGGNQGGGNGQPSQGNPPSNGSGSPSAGQPGNGQQPQGTPPTGFGNMRRGGMGNGMMSFGLVNALIQQLETLTGKS